METRYDPDAIVEVNFVFELPMRDGNTAESNIMRSKGCGFWTSYEGWRQRVEDELSIVARKVFVLPMRDGNLPDLEAHGGRRRVFELPMRDGNSPPALLVMSWTSFLNFLWGMETWRKARIRLVEEEFLNFLWGMETSAKLFLFVQYNHVFELPMRDGNKTLQIILVQIV